MISIANQIEVRHLKYFTVLASELHYRKASEKLFISQSALSQQINQLEGILGTALLERTNKKVSLTNAGLIFYRDTQLILTRLDSAVINLQRWKAGNTGQIGIGFVASAMASVLPGLLKRFNKECPNIRFQLDELSNKDQLSALQLEKIDLGFMRSNHVPDGYDSRCVKSETFSLVLPESHPVTARSFKNMGQFRDESFILFPNEQSPLYYQQIINLCADHGFTPNVAHRSIHAPTIFRLVEYGMGLSIIPTSLASRQYSGIRCIELKNIPQRTSLYAVWQKHNLNPALPYFLEMLDNGCVIT